MKTLPIIGLVLFLIGFGIFNTTMFISEHKLDDKALIAIYNPADKNAKTKYHAQAIKEAAGGRWEKTYSSNVAFINAFKGIFKDAQDLLKQNCGLGTEGHEWNCDPAKLPEGVGEWDYRMGDWNYKPYVQKLTKSTTETSLMGDQSLLFLLLSLGLASLGGFLMFLPIGLQPAGIKHNGIYSHPATKGVTRPWRIGFLLFVGLTIVLLWFIGKGAYMYINKEFNLVLFWGTMAITLAIAGIVWWGMRQWKRSARSASPNGTGWLSVMIGVYLVSFYIVLYFNAEYLTNWMLLVDPISKALSGNAADQWFVYGLLYTIVIFVMGIRMFFKYRHNRYQQVRTASVMFFQFGFAFMLPGILARFNNPAVDLKTAWPLDYTFFYDYRLDQYLETNTNSLMGIHVGTAMFVWGLILMLVIVPLFTYIYGKRWYCSWVCGCGGLAETLGDPFRQQSDKSLSAWRAERYIIYGVLVVITVMSIMLIVKYRTGFGDYGIFKVDDLKSWYGFLIGAAFAGVVGTGFYPLMGNRVWCRFGCPLAAILGIVQRFKSRFRITTNGGQCISCGNCSTYCEMGIDVRWYAQRGQDIVRASCVGCGVCSAVCPRGVLRLENASEDVNSRAQEQRVIKISKEGITLEG